MRRGPSDRGVLQVQLCSLTSGFLNAGSEMASNSPPDIDRRNSTADISSHVATLRHITNQGKIPQHVQTLFSCLSESVSQVLPDIPNLDSASLKDVYTNDRFLDLLKVITELGSCAKSDREKCLELQRHESKVFGLTGSVIDRDHEQMDSSHDVTMNPVQPLPLDDRWQALDASISSCQSQLQQLESLPLVENLRDYAHAVKFLKSNKFTPGLVASAMNNSLAQHQQLEMLVKTLRAQIMCEVEDLAVSCRFLEDVMEKWRRAEAWMYVGIITASTEKIDSVMMDLDFMFCKYLDVLTNVTRLSNEVADDTTAAVRKKIYEIQNKVILIGWHMNQKPQPCVLETQKMSISVRAFLLQKKDIEAVKLYIFPESDYVERYNKKYLYTDTKPEIVDSDGSKGSTVTVTNVKLKKCERAQKRNYATCCQQFYRVSFLVTLQSVYVEWLSAPFCVRTGSQQLWECVGAVTWYCFTAQELYRQPFKCPTEMSIPQLLAMLQAMILTRDPDKKLDGDEMEALAEMLNSLTKTDNVSLLDFVKHSMPKQGREKSGQNEFPCFTWFVAALNTHTYLMDNTNLRDCSDFAGYDQVEKKCGRKIDMVAWIRISRNEVEAASGQFPHAHVVVHVNTALGVRTLVASHTKLKERALSSRVRNLKDRDGKRLVLTIHPSDLPVEKLDNSLEELIQVNSYRTQFKTRTKDILFEGDFEKMHIRDKRDESGTDLMVTDNDSRNEVPAKQARICMSKSSPAAGRQPQFPPCADSSFLSADKPSASVDNYQELYASISSPLSDDTLQLYMTPPVNELQIDFMEQDIQQLSQSQPGNIQQSQPGNIQQSQPGNIQQSQPGNIQQSQPGNIQQSQPGNIQQSQPGNIQQSQPRNIQQSQPGNIQQ